MRLGYPCLNRSLTQIKNRTFRLKSYSEIKSLSTIKNNLNYLEEILEFNQKKNLGFFRISSDIIPFASHPICSIPWQTIFMDQLQSIGNYIKKNHFRISMHPSQFVLINANNPSIIEKSINDLKWHCLLLDTMELDQSAKIQIHIGGAYGDKKSAMERFIKNYLTLPQHIQSRLVIENDDKIFNINDCWAIHSAIGIPIVFDNLHHECNNTGESMLHSISKTAKSWSSQDGAPMLDYSSQEPNAVKGKHASTLNKTHFIAYIKQIMSFNLDIMLEIKDKEISALKALAICQKMKLTF